MKNTEKMKSILISETVHTQIKVLLSQQGKLIKPVMEELILDYIKKNQ